MTISVVLCSYNGRKYIKEQLNSIIHQSCKADEIIICDDNSNDETPKIAEEVLSSSFKGSYQIIKNPQTYGPAGNFERGMRKCNGDIIFLSDQDDLWDNHKIETMIEPFCNDKTVMVYSNALYMNSEGEKTNEKVVKQKQEFMDFFIRKMKSPNGCLMAVKKKFIDQIMPFYIQDHFFHDLWIAYSAPAFYSDGVRFLDFPLVFYRRHEQSITQAQSTQTEYCRLINNSSLLEKHFRLDIFTYERIATMKEVLRRFGENSNDYLFCIKKCIITYDKLKIIENSSVIKRIYVLMSLFCQGLYYYMDCDVEESTKISRIKRLVSDIIFIISNANISIKAQ